MSSTREAHNQEHLDQLCLYALQALPPREIAAAEAQISRCAECREEMETLRPVVGSFAGWSSMNVLRPAESLWGRLANRIADETGKPAFVPPVEPIAKPEWEEAAPGIYVKVLARDEANDSVSMLVK